jgi:Uma2 family endonuclease
MTAVAENQKISYEQYLALAESTDDVLEYHDGEVVAMVAPGIEHARIVGQLVHLLRLRLPEKSACAVVPAGLKIRVETINRTLIPDVTVVCSEAQRSQLDRHALVNPVIVFEVLSPSTEAYDQGIKVQHYRRIPSLRECVIVAQERRFAVVYRRVGDVWQIRDVEADGILELESLGIEFPLSDIYRDALGEIVR